MPGSRITADQKRAFYRLTRDPNGPRMPMAAAARQIGISKATAYRLNLEIEGRNPNSGQKEARARSRAIPGPRPLTELSTQARDALADFNLFGEMFFALRPAHWRRDAAMRVVDALQDHTRRTYIDMNLFPGVGKTTLGKVVCCWLICGGGVVDPGAGRGIRIMLGSETEKVAKHMLRNVRIPLELTRPFAMFEKTKREWVEAEYCLQLEYGRFRPDTSIGEESLWSQDQLLVAQISAVDLVLKEPTVQIASEQSGFLGERVDLALWDDLTTTKNSTNPDQAERINVWFENEAETRVEKGGVMWLIGQRLNPQDLHRKRLDAKVESPTEPGRMVPLYEHIIYPAHWDRHCDGKVHRQWDPTTNDGCLTDADALPVSDWINVRSKQAYRTVYQQEDADPARILVQQAWLEGGVDVEGFMAPGCYDRDRGFHEWPEGIGRTIDYVSVDPAAGNWWALEWWSVQPETRHNYLIEGRRGKISAGQFLDWDNGRQEFSGWMHEIQAKSYELGHPIRVWIIESVAAHKYLFQFEHFRRWRSAFPNVAIIAHETQRNKIDEELGVEGLMPRRYRSGMKHLPKKRGIEPLNYMAVKERELTTYPYTEVYDTVMADWMGEWNLDKIIVLGRNELGEPLEIEKQQEQLPGYLRRQIREYSLQ